MASNTSQRKNEVNLKLLRYLSANPSASTRQIAKDLAVSNGSAYYLLRALIEKGLVKVKRFVESENKNQYKYLLTSAGIDEKIKLTKIFIHIKRQEYQVLKRDVKAMEIELQDIAGCKYNPPLQEIENSQ